MMSGWSGPAADNTWTKFEITLSSDEDVELDRYDEFCALPLTKQMLIMRNACEMLVIVERYARACIPEANQIEYKNRLLALRTLVDPYFK
jgi:hypothetical protein